MGRSKSLERLLRIRTLEEGQRRASLESALGELDALQRARQAAAESERNGRARVGASAAAGGVVDRQAALVETEAARRRGRMLAPRITAGEREAALRRQEFIAKRVERRQAGTLVEQAEAQEEIEAERRTQQATDDWYGARRRS
jgi:hypothetical protein